MNTVYTKTKLEEICERDKSKIDFDKIKTYNRTIVIEFICSCGKCDTRTFRAINSNGIFCKDCMNLKTQEKYKQTCFKKYGVENAGHVKEFQDKRQAACLEKYGVISFFKTEAVKEKIKATCLKKFGVENYVETQEFKEQYKQTCLKKFGVEHPLQLEEFKEKHKQTCLKKFGTEYPMQNAEVAEKQAKSFFKKKSYTFPTGEEINIQGYENYLLDILIKEGYTFKDILTKRTDVPEVWYTEDNKKHRYYCDIYIPKINKVYEVKSIWTNGRNIDTNKLKKEACLKAGFEYELFVFNKKGIRQIFE